MDQVYSGLVNLIGMACGGGLLAALAIFFVVGIVARLHHDI